MGCPFQGSERSNGLVGALPAGEPGAAARLLQSGFPDREIIRIPCSALIQQYGSLHCLTMQFPKGVEFRTSITR
jgi:hypothetical protein